MTGGLTGSVGSGLIGGGGINLQMAEQNLVTNFNLTLIGDTMFDYIRFDATVIEDDGFISFPIKHLQKSLTEA